MVDGLSPEVDDGDLGELVKGYRRAGCISSAADDQECSKAHPSKILLVCVWKTALHVGQAGKEDRVVLMMVVRLEDEFVPVMP
jgi:hypothetical protein